MAESKKGHNSVNISRNSLKGLLGHLNINSNLYAKYQNTSSSGSQDIVLTSFSIAILVELKKGHKLVNISRNLLKS